MFLAVCGFFLFGTDASVLPPMHENPVIVIAPAAWHSPVHYSQCMHELQLPGFKRYSERLPSCDSDNPYEQSVQRDTEFLQAKLLMPLIDAGKMVVLILHSYSGGMAAKGLSTVSRSGNQPVKVGAS